jgi:hypothetical protein
MSVGISIYRMIFKENNEEIDVGEKFTDINQNEESLHDIVVSVFNEKTYSEMNFKLDFFEKIDEFYFGKFFYGKILETDRSIIINDEEKQMKARKDISRDEFYFMLVQEENKLLPKGNKTIFLFLQTNGIIGIKTGVLDNVYLKKINAKLSALNKAKGRNISVTINSYNITEKKIIDLYNDSFVKSLQFYNENNTEDLQKKVEGTHILRTKNFKIKNKTIIEGVTSSLKDFFSRNKEQKSVYEIIFSNEDTEEVEIEISNGNRTRKLIRKTKEEKIENIQARFDVTTEYQNANGDKEKIFDVFYDLFCDIIKENNE